MAAKKRSQAAFFLILKEGQSDTFLQKSFSNPAIEERALRFVSGRFVESKLVGAAVPLPDHVFRRQLVTFVSISIFFTRSAIALS